MRETVPCPGAMTLTTKPTNEPDSTAKPGAASQNSEGNSNTSQRSNPVCLEVGVTLRSLPAEPGGLNQPIREDVKTVIVFDNGAVLRSSKSLPSGQKIILTNQRGRDVVCKVGSGRNMPSVKGYLEVEFMEAVPDFWQIHQNAQPVIPPPKLVPTPSLPEALKETSPRPTDTIRPAMPAADAANPVNQSSGSGPSFEDIPGLISIPPRGLKRDAKHDSAKLDGAGAVKGGMRREVGETGVSASLATPRSHSPEPTWKRSAGSASKEMLQTTPQLSGQTADFLGKGMFNSSQYQSSTSNSGGRKSLIIVAILLVLAGAGGGIYYLMHRESATVPVLNVAVKSEAAVPAPPPARIAPEPVKSPPQTEPQIAEAAPLAAIEQVQPTVAVVPIPSASGSAAKKEAHSVQPRGKNLVAESQTASPPTSHPVIPNLKLKSPISPGKNLANPGEETAPLTEVGSAESMNGPPPVGLLSAGSRASSPPVPVAFPAANAPAAKILIDPKLISSTRPVYPPTARDSKIQGSVEVEASIDERGNVFAVKAISGPTLLRQAALDSVKRWKYSPATLDGKPTSSQVTINIEFRLK